jgi:hypothetical protein
MDHVTCEIEYDAQHNMYCVTVYVNGHWDMEAWFHDRASAELFAKQKELRYGLRHAAH